MTIPVHPVWTPIVGGWSIGGVINRQLTSEWLEEYSRSHCSCTDTCEALALVKISVLQLLTCHRPKMTHYNFQWNMFTEVFVANLKRVLQIT